MDRSAQTDRYSRIAIQSVLSRELQWMSGKMLVESPLSLHIQGDVSRSTG